MFDYQAKIFDSSLYILHNSVLDNNNLVSKCTTKHCNNIANQSTLLKRDDNLLTSKYVVKCIMCYLQYRYQSYRT